MSDHQAALHLSRPALTLLIRRAQALVDLGGRRILGITGAPAAGKSTLAEQIVRALHPDAILVSMDGFHLAEAELQRLGIQERKGAVDTFDAAGFVELLRRLRTADEAVVYAPHFRRDLEESIAGSIAVTGTVPLVVTEGNYLLTQIGDWARVKPLLDDTWYIDPDETTRMDRLIERHMLYGRDRARAEARARGTDQRNADLIAATKERADLILCGGWRD